LAGWFADRAAANRLAGRSGACWPTWPARPPDVFPELTDRERELLGLIAQGYNNSQIAAELVISPKTVSNHITNILSKLQVADRAEAIIKAREAGL
jgi:DNA-binding NarL/FixJ family response regulator